MDDLEKLLAAHDCWDIGCGPVSIEWCRDAFGARRPIGINIDPADLQPVLDAGHDGLLLDALTIPPGVRTDVINITHILEHVVERSDVRRIMEIALAAARDLVFIAGPYFDDDPHLRSTGYKFNWADWDGHMNTHSLPMMEALLRELGVRSWVASLGFPVSTPARDTVYRIEDLRNQPEYDPGRDMPKTDVQFPRPYYEEFAICIPLSPRFQPQAIIERRHGLNGAARRRLRDFAVRWPRAGALALRYLEWRNDERYAPNHLTHTAPDAE